MSLRRIPVVRLDIFQLGLQSVFRECKKARHVVSGPLKTLKTVSTKECQYATARHLPVPLNSECANAYCDDCFSVLLRARPRDHLEVLESVYMYIHVQRPDFKYMFKRNCETFVNM